MTKKITGWTTKGMNKDMSVSKFNPEFAFENVNLRLSTNEGNTMMSWVNEKGTQRIPLYDTSNNTVTIQGIPIGTAVLNKYLVIFTTSNTFSTHAASKIDHIYRLEYKTDKSALIVTELIKANLNFSTKNPIETLTSFEAEHIQKVYWTDGRNQPRLINIVSDKLVTGKWNTGLSDDVFTLFDFVPTYAKSEEMVLSRYNSGGIFAPGVIQYCFTYINKYGQQSNIIKTTSMYYLCAEERGLSPEELTTNSFSILIKSVDDNYDYIRVYSIHRTSINAVPTVKVLGDYAITTIAETFPEDINPVTVPHIYCIDDGTVGYTIDPQEMLYIGGKSIIANTLIDKDQTLFLGNIEQAKKPVTAIQNWYRNNNVSVFFYSLYNDRKIPVNPVKDYYSYTNLMSKGSSSKITTFKSGETYRFGFQLQTDTGEWTDPIWIGDDTNDKCPRYNNDNTLSLPIGYAIIDISDLEAIVSNFRTQYKKIRPVIVYPTISDRTILCQGVINPTVFNLVDRYDKYPFAQASWYFRPYMVSYYSGGTENANAAPSGAYLEYSHYKPLKVPPTGGSSNYDQRLVEIQGSKIVVSNILGSTTIPDNFRSSNTQFHVDQSILTLNSPDIEFDTEVQDYPCNDLKLRVIGTIPIHSNISAHSIKTSSAMLEKEHNDSPDDIVFGGGDNGKNVRQKASLYYPAGVNIYAGNRLVSEYLWNDVFVVSDPDQEDKIKTNALLYDYLIYPWHRSGSLNNDFREADVASSLLKTKKESNLLYSGFTHFFKYQDEQPDTIDFPNIGVQMILTENSQITNYRLKKQKDTFSDINYYPNIDKILYNTDGYPVRRKNYNPAPENNTDTKVNTPVSMKYKSTSHAVVALNAIEEIGDNRGKIPLMPYGTKTVGGTVYDYGKYTSTGSDAVWGDTGASFYQESIALTNDCNYLLLGELYKDVSNRFGGTSDEALRSNKWIVAGEELSIPSTGDVTLYWTEGDTYYQRYDCLKTYPFTNEDPNQLVEILSFMCETHVNIDGRYDRNRGQIDNTNMRPEIFNLLNPVYSQRNNFFPVKIENTDSRDKYNYPNYVYYSKTKASGADVDQYTNITLASVLELDGNKGKLNALKRLNDNIMAFQDTGIARILFNVNAAVATSAGVPIEIANSGKVEGKQYISDTIGCSNKWSIVNTPLGIYFINSHDKSIYRLGEGLENISLKGGLSTWCNQNIPSPDVYWDPVNFNNFRAFYDKNNQDVLFVNNDIALAWSEKFDVFTSFYSYGSSEFFNSLDGTGVWIKKDGVDSSLHKHNAGGYCSFFDTQYPYSMTLVGNPEPTTNKIFTNLEMASNIDGEGRESSGTYTPHLPFSHLEAWNEYQHGIATLNNLTGSAAMKHFNGIASSLKRKFRLWRCDIPRDNAAVDSSVAAPFSTDTALGIKRFRAHSVDRMRNPWLYLKLYQDTSYSHRKTEIHDILMTYFD